MEDGNTAQLTTVPFRLVFVELGVDRLKERTHKRDFESRTDDGALEVKVSHCEK